MKKVTPKRIPGQVRPCVSEYLLLALNHKQLIDIFPDFSDLKALLSMSFHSYRGYSYDISPIASIKILIGDFNDKISTSKKLFIAA